MASGLNQAAASNRQAVGKRSVGAGGDCVRRESVGKNPGSFLYRFPGMPLM